MKKIILDGKLMPTMSVAHQYIAKLMDFPDYYGNNLDALWDMLSTYEQSDIVFLNCLDICVDEESYRQPLIQTFLEAAEENTNLILEFLE